jgi:hypothetical protein
MVKPKEELAVFSPTWDDEQPLKAGTRLLRVRAPKVPRDSSTIRSAAEMNNLGQCELLFDQGRPVGSTGRKHGIVEVKSRMVQHGVQFAGALRT